MLRPHRQRQCVAGHRSVPHRRVQVGLSTRNDSSTLCKVVATPLWRARTRGSGSAFVARTAEAAAGSSAAAPCRSGCLVFEGCLLPAACTCRVSPASGGAVGRRRRVGAAGRSRGHAVVAALLVLHLDGAVRQVLERQPHLRQASQQAVPCASLFARLGQTKPTSSGCTT